MSKQSEKNKRMYDQRRAEGLCLWCGKPLDREGSLCQACKDKGNRRAKRNKDYYLSIGICPYCRKRKVSPGYKSCVPCRLKFSAKSKQDWGDSKKKEHYLQKKKELRQKRIEAGICTKCGKNMAEPGFRTCIDCRKSMRNYRKIYITKYQLSDRALWKDQGRCSRCGADEQYEGFSLCKKCYMQSVEALEKGRNTVLKHRAEERARLEAIEAQKQIEVKKMMHPRTIAERRNKTGEN